MSLASYLLQKKPYLHFLLSPPDYQASGTTVSERLLRIPYSHLCVSSPGKRLNGREQNILRSFPVPTEKIFLLSLRFFFSCYGCGILQVNQTQALECTLNVLSLLSSFVLNPMIFGSLLNLTGQEDH